MPGFFQRARDYCRTHPYVSTESNLNVQKLQAGLTLVNNLLTNIQNQTGTNITIRAAQLLALIHVIFRADTNYSEKLFHSLQFGMLVSLLTFEVMETVSDETCENGGVMLKTWLCLSESIVNQIYTGTNLFVWALGEFGQSRVFDQNSTEPQANASLPVEPELVHPVIDV